MGIEKEVYVLEKEHGQSQDRVDPMDEILIAIDENGADKTGKNISPRSHLLTKVVTQMKEWGRAIGMESSSSQQQERSPSQRLRFFR